MPISTQQRSAYNLRMPPPALITPSAPKMLTFNAHHHLTPITTLPPEILEAIFKICISWLYQPRAYTSSSPTPPAQNTHLAWTQVCSAWRLISLSSPRLWRTIDLAASPSFTISSIKKSKKALIDIISSTPLYGLLRLFSNDAEHATSPVLSSLRSNAHRIRSIDLFLFASDMYALFHTTFPLPLPNLTSLTLKLPPLSRTVVLPLSLPLVRHLSLEGVALNRAAWSELRELKYLSLKGLDEESCPSIEELLGILARSPALEHLILEDYRPSSPKIPLPSNDNTNPIQTDPPEPISLAHLQHLTISSSQPILTSLFSPKHHLILTTHTRIRLFSSLSDDLHTIFPSGRLPWAYDHDYDARRGPSSVKQVRLSLSPDDQVHDRPSSDPERNGTHPFVSASNPTISTIRLSKNGAHFLTSNTPAWTTDAQTSTPPQSPILFSLSSARPVGTRICASLPHLFGNKLGWISKLELNTGVLTTSSTVKNKLGHGELGIPEDALRALFENLPSVETLCVAFNDLSSLWKVLTPPQPLPRHTILPRLKNLSFSKPSEVWTHFSERWSTPLVKFIKSRSKPKPKSHQEQPNTAVQPIEAVEFLRCQGVRNHTRQREDGDENEDLMRELRRLVRDVIVRDEMGAKSRF